MHGVVAQGLADMNRRLRSMNQELVSENSQLLHQVEGLRRKLAGAAALSSELQKRAQELESVRASNMQIRAALSALTQEAGLTSGTPIPPLHPDHAVRGEDMETARMKDTIK